MKIEKKYYILFGFLGLLIVLAILSFIYQTSKGLSVTGLKEPVVWGIYVANFTFFFGLGTGTLMLIIFGSIIKAGSDEFVLFSSLAAFISFGLTGAFIVLDLGRIERFYYLVIYAQLKSPLVWDFIVMNIFIAICVIFIFASLRRIFLKAGIREKAPSVEKLVFKIVTTKKELRINKSLLIAGKVFILLLVAGCYIVTTEVFISVKARPEWHTPLLSLIFFISAILSGLSVIMFSGSFWGNTAPGGNRNVFVGRIKIFLLFLLTADLIVILIKYGMDFGNPLIKKIHTIFPFSPIFFLIIGDILPLLLALIYKHERKIFHRLIPVLILFGVLLKRIDIIIPAYFRRWLPFAGKTSYLPTAPEILISLGVYSGGIMVITVAFFLMRSFFLRQKSDSVQKG